MKTKVLFIAALMLMMLGIVDVRAQQSIVLNQKDSPVVFSKFEAQYQPDRGQYQREGIRYRIEFSNVSEKRIVAYQVSFIAFDVFNRPLGRPLGGYSIKTIEHLGSESGSWLQRTSNSALFRDYGTALAYISLIRFDDGVIWKYDTEEVLLQLQEFEESLTIEDLQSE